MACYFDELHSRSASLGWVPASRLMGQVQPKLVSWSDVEPDDGVPDMSGEFAASSENRRRATLGAEGWIEGPDRLWRKSFDNAEWLPKCEIGYATHAVVRYRASGVTIHDTAGPTHLDCSSLPRAFRTPRDVDMVVETKFGRRSQCATTVLGGDGVVSSRGERIPRRRCEAQLLGIGSVRHPVREQTVLP